jgi:hypothetical protein
VASRFWAITARKHPKRSAVPAEDDFQHFHSRIKSTGMLHENSESYRQSTIYNLQSKQTRIPLFNPCPPETMMSEPHTAAGARTVEAPPGTGDIGFSSLIDEVNQGFAARYFIVHTNLMVYIYNFHIS